MNRRRHKTVSVTLDRLEVDIALQDIETDDLLEELELRQALHGMSKTDVERETITQRFHEQRKRFHTQSPGVITPEERDFWYHVHAKDL